MRFLTPPMAAFFLAFGGVWLAATAFSGGWRPRLPASPPQPGSGSALAHCCCWCFRPAATPSRSTTRCSGPTG
ncbi:hypothetical protein E6W36_07795 [Hankyongella ginsenosidimutans]|uniref:Uncharacterized protein n=1 Tax=Hankyongella ginsenosidimutans TaxID=1763828 RepID=A0A4D7C7Y2_9SPHN|nr:hypothetical protein [Hankyongella ginsenosidimutans]QCI79478.1 hypothetical protein E6W36_07795 [Hankyongella ginsenosidimutans]